jgi:hypothetical protein
MKKGLKSPSNYVNENINLFKNENQFDFLV